MRPNSSQPPRVPRFTSLRRGGVAVALVALSLTGANVVSSTAVTNAATPTTKFANCTALNKVYKHGVGQRGAKDKTSGKPVRTFYASTPLYTAIIKNNRGLDRDRDGIACEKA